MINFFMNNINGLLITGDCSVLGTDFTKILKEVFMWIQIATPCLVIILCTVDVVQAVIAQEEKSMKEAQRRIIKRVMIGVAIFFVPILLDILLDFAGLATGTCGIGG